MSQAVSATIEIPSIIENVDNAFANKGNDALLYPFELATKEHHRDRMRKIFHKIDIIEDVFETMYITKSMIICKDVPTMYYMKNILTKLDYPVEILTIKNAKDVLIGFSKHKIRMIIVSEACFDVFTSYLSFMFSYFDAIFIDDFENSGLQLTANNFEGKKIFFI